jgi:zinc transporter ZupT
MNDAILIPFLFSLIAGLMMFISFDELLPISLSHREAHPAITSLFLGMLTMTAILFLLG